MTYSTNSGRMIITRPSPGNSCGREDPAGNQEEAQVTTQNARRV